VALVFKILNHAGVSQRRLAAAIGIKQSEVSEIIGGRCVQSVYLLERIADGLGCPRAWWGLAHDVTGLGYAGDQARVTLAITVENARQVAVTVAALASQVAALLRVLGIPSSEPCPPS
jgi:transcriptional regulator with XRE-family HTH domain